ncbi:MAG: hypothetical protein HYU99_07465 [Deltaproteobacteria bacterium]|nr:hypothetical protein [Deltaproteobacteria bacterium]
MGDNEIKDMLCDYGIQDISFGGNYPDIELDVENGYIHFSTKLLLEIYPWLEEEVTP